MTRAGLLCATLVVTVATAGAAQVGPGGLADAAERARAAWQVKDVAGLLAGSDTVQVQLPGGNPAAPMNPDQARRVLAQHLEGAEERTLAVVSVREVGSGRGYAELERHYIIARTRDERCESVFLGFRRVGGRWVVSEVRITR
jgi:hypothetical protein